MIKCAYLDNPTIYCTCPQTKSSYLCVMMFQTTIDEASTCTHYNLSP